MAHGKCKVGTVIIEQVPGEVTGGGVGGVGIRRSDPCENEGARPEVQDEQKTVTRLGDLSRVGRQGRESRI